MLSSLLPLVSLLSLAAAQSANNETVLGIYMFHRHGDRTAKSIPPTVLTDLGYSQVYASGQYYRNRYVASNATFRIAGLNTDLVNQNQIAISAPADNVLMSSALGFLQGLYPPVGEALGSQLLRDKTNATSPMNGYQIIPVSVVANGAGSEDATWLQSTSNCNNAQVSSNNFFTSAEYISLYNSSQELYQSILPVINGTFTSATDDFKNAYAIWDLINVAEIHNATINSSDLLTPSTFSQLSYLANVHEWGLAYNASEPIRAIAGMTLSAQIVQFLNATLTSHGKQSLAVQFGSYGQFSSFFGLADLPAVNPNFYDITDYASAMTFELFTNTSTPVTKTSYPSVDETYVRFLFHNGTTNSSSPPTVYPLFGSGQDVLSFSDFAKGMNAFAIGNTSQWCMACGNTTGACASSSSAIAPSTANQSASSGGNGLSPAVNGVIGAMVTLAVVLGVEALVMLLGGLRLVRENRCAEPMEVVQGAGKA